VRSHILINQVGLVHSGAIQRRSHLKLTKHSDDNKSLLIATNKPVAATMSAGGEPQKLGLWLTVSQKKRRSWHCRDHRKHTREPTLQAQYGASAAPGRATRRRLPPTQAACPKETKAGGPAR